MGTYARGVLAHAQPEVAPFPRGEELAYLSVPGGIPWL